jgi:hypothetical protein
MVAGQIAGTECDSEEETGIEPQPSKKPVISLMNHCIV